MLGPELPLVASLPHPVSVVVDPADPDLRVRRAYWDPALIATSGVEGSEADQPHTLAGLFTSLARANFRIDALLEPEPRPSEPRSPQWTPANQLLPSTLIVRARKQGI